MDGYQFDSQTALTQTIKAAAALVDVQVLDHFIVTDANVRSMAECGLI